MGKVQTGVSAYGREFDQNFFSSDVKTKGSVMQFRNRLVAKCPLIRLSKEKLLVTELL